MKITVPKHFSRSTIATVILGVIVFAVVMVQLIAVVVWEPLKTRFHNLEFTESKLQDIQMVVARGERAKGYCDRLAKESLSDDPTVVAQKYQQWLLKRTEGLGEISVMPSAPVAEPALGWRVPFQVEGDCPLDGLAEMVDELNQIPLLHRITYLNIQRETKASAKKDSVHFSLTLDALAMKNSASLNAFPTATQATDDDNLQRFIAERKIFTQGYLGPTPPPAPINANKETKKPVPTAQAMPKLDSLKTLKLIGSVELDGVPQAWLVDTRTRQEFLVSKAEPVAFEDFKATITSISSDFVELQMEGRLIQWPMGQSLRSVLDRTR